MENDICSNCGHAYSAVCSLCKRELGCGSATVPCRRIDCTERVIYYGDDKKTESLPGIMLEGRTLEDPFLGEPYKTNKESI